MQNVASGAASSIGRYFNAVNTMPSLALVLLTFTLVTSGAWSGPPRLTSTWNTLTHLSIGGAASLLAVALALSLVLHPLQFAIVQVFEGYWGTAAIAQRASATRVMHHRRRRARLVDHDAPTAATWALKELPAEDVAYWRIRYQEALRVGSRYPKDTNDVMPTRLGNVLRRYERLAGHLYGLDPVIVIPLIAAIAPHDQAAYLDDQRTQLDLAVRTAFTALLATGISVVFLWWHGLWLALALIFYGAAYLAYRGAVVTAESYGLALVTLIELNRFDLYRQLHLPLPADTRTEKLANQELMDALTRQRGKLKYIHPDTTSDQVQSTASTQSDASPEQPT